MGRPMMPRPIKPIFMSVLLCSRRNGHRGQPGHDEKKSDAEFLAPFQASDSVARWTVFTADPALVAKLVHPAEHELPANLASTRLVAGRNVGDLHVRDDRQMQFHPLGHIALGRLAMVYVELQAKTVAADSLDHGGTLRLRVQEISGHVAVIDRLDDHLHPAGLRLFAGPGETPAGTMPAIAWTSLQPSVSA